MVKDQFHVKGFHTRVGTSFFGNEIEEIDAASGISSYLLIKLLVEKLRKAGAIVLGKNSMHEIGIGVNGHNEHYGIIRNAYNTSYYAGGSSSGTANAIAAGILFN